MTCGNSGDKSRRWTRQAAKVQISGSDEQRAGRNVGALFVCASTRHLRYVVHLYVRVELALSAHIALHGIAQAALNVRARDRPFAAPHTIRSFPIQGLGA